MKDLTSLEMFSHLTLNSNRRYGLIHEAEEEQVFTQLNNDLEGLEIRSTETGL
jgi:hypothetical protein